MSKTSYDVYGELSEEIDTHIIISGRNAFQYKQVDAIITDVKQKLSPKRNNTLLEIGCNLGLLLTPLSECVEFAVGVDHPSILKKYKSNGVPDNVELFGGSWPNVDMPYAEFDHILVYSVLHGLDNKETALSFIAACLACLNRGGTILLGDIPNENMRQRFLSSEKQKIIAGEYDELREKSRGEDDAKRGSIFSQCNPDIFLNDDFVTSLLKELRTKGYDAFVLPQYKGLPFYLSREDILVFRRD